MFKILVLEMLKNRCKSDFNLSFMRFFCGLLLLLRAVELAAAPHTEICRDIKLGWVETKTLDLQVVNENHVTCGEPIKG